MSNAWDAGARRVDITTGVPSFGLLSIRDNGDGMSRSQFEQLMTDGIGNSSKRGPRGGETSPSGRPVIGRFGIGMLGIAQICTEFIVASRPQQGEAFSARVRIVDFLRDKIDQESPEAMTPGTEDSEVFIGTWDWLSTEEPNPSWRHAQAPEQHGTQILITQPHPSFTLGFKNSLRPVVSAALDRKRATQSVGVSPTRLAADPTAEEIRSAIPPASWEQFVEQTKQVRRVEMLGDYWSFIWSLAASCPVPYLDEYALPERLAVEEQRRLESYDFTVTVDGRPLRKPVLLRKRKKHGYSVQRIEPFSREVFGQTLSFHGYIVVQEGSQITPDELRGLLVRVNDVAVGSYDPSLLGYKINQGPRSRWITGEIFVSAGLEDAVNIDRDSFNIFHPHYKELQSVVHEALGKLFTQVYRKLSKRSEEAGKDRNERRAEAVRDALVSVAGTPVEISFTGPVDQDSAVRRATSKRLEMRLVDPDDIDVRNVNRLLASAILGIFDLSSMESTSLRRRERFAHLLTELLQRW